MITVRSISGRPLRGSSSRGSSSSTSAISLPRSPQPTYTMMSASLHLASDCCSTVLPVPKLPGIAARPPRAIGNSVSRMRCPVIIGLRRSGKRCWLGRGCADRPRCASESSVGRAVGAAQGANRFAIRVFARGGDRHHRAAAARRNQTMLRAWLSRPRRSTGRARSTSPPARRAQRRSARSSGCATPGRTKEPAHRLKGRNSPSKIWPSKPGTELDRQRLAGAGNSIARLESGRVLVDLRNDLIGPELDDLAEQGLGPTRWLPARETGPLYWRAAPAR